MKIGYIFTVLACFFLQISFSLEADLLDTRTATSDVGWNMPQDSEWEEASGHNQNGEEQRMLLVCQIQKNKQDNWVRSPFIPVNDSKRIYIEFAFTMRSCDDVPNVATCKETFNLYYYETDLDEATSTFPPWNEEAYTKVDTIAADKKFHRGTAVTNLETRDIGPLTKNGIYIALRVEPNVFFDEVTIRNFLQFLFHITFLEPSLNFFPFSEDDIDCLFDNFLDTGACMALLHLRVYYKFCAPTLINLAQFPKTLVGPERTSLVKTDGICTENSVEDKKNPPILYCNSNGEWAVPKGQCLCKPGSSPDQRKTSCIACSRGLYKSQSGNTPCNRCPAYSHSHDYGSTVCDCMFGYFRATSDSSNVACTKPPSKPTNLDAYVNDTKVTLTWDRPLNDGGREDLFYRVDCEICPKHIEDCSPCPKNLDFLPGNTNLRVSQVEVQGFYSFNQYKFIVLAENGVSDEARKYGIDVKYAVVTVEIAQTRPSKVFGVDINDIEYNSFFVTWKGQGTSGNLDIKYEIIISDLTDQEPVRLNITGKTSTIVKDLTSGRNYLIKVRASNVKGYGAFSDPVMVKTLTEEKTPSSDPHLDDRSNTSTNTRNFVVITIGVTSCLFCALVILAIVYIWRRHHSNSCKQSHNDFEKYPMYTGGTLLSLGSPSTIQKTYVDPSTYEDPNQALNEFTKEIDSRFVTIESVIGAGEFGEVCRGFAIFYQSSKPKQVAIKTLKFCSTTQQKLDFLGEASIMGQFDHPNVIRLEGVVTKSQPLMIITEYMENGSLDIYLRKHDGELNVVELVGMMRNIGSGMKYLSGMGYVHRDLAARNILVNSCLVCKVSDFGMSRVLEEDEDATYITKGGKIPIRWTAPEAITFRKFTSSSDVWSYGIVMWEVMSYGERPYWEMTNRDVIQAISSEYRLSAPMDCPLILHQIMLECWKKNRTERPKFADIVTTFDRILKEPSQLRIKASVSDKNNGRLIPAVEGLNLPTIIEEKKSYYSDENIISTPTPADVSFLEVWLDKIGLSLYKDNFLQCGCYSLEQILKLNLNDLCKLGVTNTNHQNILLNQIYAINQQKELYKEDNDQGISV